MGVTRLGIRSGGFAVAEAGLVIKRLAGELVVVEGAADDPSVLLEALTDGVVDAVLLPAGLASPGARTELAGIPKRRDARDGLTGDVTLAGLPAGAPVAVDSSLRRAQLLGRRTDLVPVPPGADAVAAIAALVALDDPDATAEVFDIADWPTAPGQGALAIFTRRGEAAIAAGVDHRASRLTVLAELGVLERLDPIAGATLAAHAELDDGLLFLSARVYHPDGSGHHTSSHALYPEDSKDPIAALADRVAAELLAQGAGSPDTGWS